MFIWLLLSISYVAFANESPKETSAAADHFSFPPNNTPVSKVVVFGRPMYVRQPFVVPLRDGVEAAEGTPGFAPIEATKKRQSGYGATEPVSGDGSDAYNNYPAEPPKPKYPLEQCYTNKAGFMCCNKDLEDLMDKVYDDLAANNGWQNCNTQKIANKLQDKAQEKFGTEFETLSSIGDFASKTHFYSDLICKTEKEGRYLLAYATPNRHNKKPEYPAAPEDDGINGGLNTGLNQGPYHTVFI